ncbi:MAG TPA: exodeoxyribonuclease VII small subunit [Clostridiales bacterium]|nr:exodeoxyribonuclease VII small subunit [Clostridiales bacterium]
MTSQKKSLKFEEAIQKLQECVEKMDAGETSLEEGIDLYEQCVMYHRQCEDILNRAKQRVEMYRPETGEIAEFGEEL